MSNSSTTPLAKANWNSQTARFLLTRAGFGGTVAQVEAVRAMGMDGAVDYLLNSGATADDSTNENTFDRNVRKPPTEEERAMYQQARQANLESAREQFQKLKNQQDGIDRAQMQEIQKWWLARLIQTGRPLEEKLTLFWHGHFATGYRTIEDSYHMFQQNQLFRTYAAGNFADLVMRIVRNPAMLKYLDNDESRKGRPNENLARELMELFVLGEGHGYTESDIKEGARALTGFTFDDDTFRFAANNHDGESKTILGQTGNWDGDDFARIILSRRETSEFLCAKLYRFFVNDSPGMPDAKSKVFSNALAAELRKQQYELKPVLWMLFRSQHFYDAANRGAVIKSPTQLIVQTIRELGTPPRELSSLNAAGDLMGQSLFMPPNVKGWDGGRSWINTSTYFVRQNVAVYLITGLRPDAFDWDSDLAKWDTTALEGAIASRTAGDASKEADALLDLVLAVDAIELRRAQFRAYVKTLNGPLTSSRLVAALCLVTAMPEYQLC